MSRYLRIKNWCEFQHYKDREPPWIKLHRALLNDYEFASLPDAGKGQLVMIWLFASQNGGRVPNDPNFLMRKLGLEKKPNLHDFIERGFLLAESAQEASAVLANGKRDAMPEAEKDKTEKDKAEAEAEAEKERPAKSPDLAPVVHEVFAHWQQVMAHPQARLDAKRDKAIRMRLKDGYSATDLCRAVDGCKGSAFHMGDNDKGTVHDDIELICRDGTHVDKFIKLADKNPAIVGLSAAGRKTAPAAEIWLQQQQSEREAVANGQH